MEDVKRRFANEIAARLAGAAESDAKAEMIEELADNLARRYDDMTAAGMDGAEAFDRAMEELGDADELTAYLNSLEAEGPAPGSGADELDELLRAMGDMGRAAAGMGRKAVDKAEDFLRSDAARNAVEEGRKAVQKAGDYLRKVAEQGAIAWNSRNVKLDFSEGSGEQSVPSQGLMRLDVELPNGDVDIRPALGPEAPVTVEGDVNELDVYVTEDGVLTVRQRHTASNQYFTFRGISGRDVSLTVPARKWDSIRVATASGDVDIAGVPAVDSLEIHTASGDIDCRVDVCLRGELKAASGDIDCRGNWQSVLAETVSGDVDLEGLMEDASVSTVSGDVEMSGSVTRARIRSMSGDIRVKSAKLPRELDMTSKSGDVGARLPEEGPFHARLDTVTGQVRYEFPREWTNVSEPGEGVPRYRLESISGDVDLKKLT